MRLKAAILLVGCAVASIASAQHDAELEPANNDVSDVASLQRGARYFVNYCMGCHSAQYVRYNRLAEGLQLSDSELMDNLMFTGERPFDTMSIAMNSEDAADWFGTAPPDLSLIARSRGTDYLYTFLNGFYVDESSPTGVDNTVLQGTAMPHVLWELQGIQEAHHEEDPAHEGEEVMMLEITQAGLLSEEEYHGVVRDIVNFLDYISEPMQLDRQRLGVRVIGFLLVLLLISYMLKKEIWKDVD
ncbi:MAG: cytochrome c1 [Gammaproteobacteria bacterium]|jgi:ubiquinol-cytochrome c reductase cytochrome c1 subunit